MLNIEHVPAQIDALKHRAVRADRAGYTQSDALHIQGRNLLFLQFIVHSLCDIVQDKLAVGLGAGRNLPHLEQLAVGLKQTHFNRRSTDIHTKCVCFTHLFLSFPRNREKGASALFLPSILFHFPGKTPARCPFSYSNATDWPVRADSLTASISASTRRVSSTLTRNSSSPR